MVWLPEEDFAFSLRSLRELVLETIGSPTTVGFGYHCNDLSLLIAVYQQTMPLILLVNWHFRELTAEEVLPVGRYFGFCFNIRGTVTSSFVLVVLNLLFRTY